MTHLIVVSATCRRFVAEPRDAANALKLAAYHDGLVQAAATQDDREYHQRAAAYYLDCADELACEPERACYADGNPGRPEGHGEER